MGGCILELASTNPVGDTSCTDDCVEGPGGPETRLELDLTYISTGVEFQPDARKRSPLNLRSGPDAFAKATAKVLGVRLGDNDPRPAVARFVAQWDDAGTSEETWGRNPLPRSDWEPLARALTSDVNVTALAEANAASLRLDGEFWSEGSRLGSTGHYFQIPRALLAEAIRIRDDDPDAAQMLARAALILDTAGMAAYVPTLPSHLANSPNRFFRFVETAQLTDDQAAALKSLADEIGRLSNGEKLPLILLVDEIIAEPGRIPDEKLASGQRLVRDLLSGPRMQTPQTSRGEIAVVHEFLLLVKARNGAAAAESIAAHVERVRDRAAHQSVKALLNQALDLSGEPRARPMIGGR